MGLTRQHNCPSVPSAFPRRPAGVSARKDATISHSSRAVDPRRRIREPSSGLRPAMESEHPTRTAWDFFLSAFMWVRRAHLEQILPASQSNLDALLAEAAAHVDLTLPNPRQNVIIVQSTRNPFFLNDSACAHGTTTTKGQLLRPYPQYTSVQLAGQAHTTASITLFSSPYREGSRARSCCRLPIRNSSATPTR